MQIPWKTDHRALCLKITVDVKTPGTNIILKVSDRSMPRALYENRYQKINKSDSFFVKMPTSPEACNIHVFNSKNGDLREGVDKSFKFKVEEVALNHWMIPSRINVPVTKEFVLLAQRFSEDASILSTGHMTMGGWMPYSCYGSEATGRVKIHYYDCLYDTQKYITDPRTGQMALNKNFGRMVTTPMRTDAETGVIEVSKRFITNYTVPMIMAILCHEFCHYFVNTKAEDEIEADRNALIIFLSLGYSKIAAYKAFIEVFKNADSKLNRERNRQIKEFIDNFDRIKFSYAA